MFFDDLLGNTDILNQATMGKRWATLARADVNLATAQTWDVNLSRNRRILVPIDVQAFVVPDEGGEATVPVTGGPGDPAPFTPGVRRETGVHVHWALPDALLQSSEAESGGELELPDLPDRWVVLRMLFPVGLARPLIRGWVVDAVNGTTTDLDGYDGTVVEGEQIFDPLDGAVGGSPLWTASYEASGGRFGLHDRLDDLDELAELAPNGFTHDQATYVVAGWSSDTALDPLHTFDLDELCERLDELRWHVDHEADDNVHEPDTPSVDRLVSQAAFARPAEEPEIEIISPDRKERFTFADVSPRTSIPIADAERIIIGPRSRRYSSLLHGMIAGVPVRGELPNADDRPTSAALEVAVGLDTDDVAAVFATEAVGVSDSERQGTEQLTAAFTAGLLDRLGTPDGLRDIEEREHTDGFWGLPGPPLEGATADTLRVADALPFGPSSVGRPGRTAAANAAGVTLDILKGENPTIAGWRDRVKIVDNPASGKGPPPKAGIGHRVSEAVADSRSVVRPAPRMFRPQPPIVAIRGCRPSLRHRGDGLYADNGALRCRYPSEAVVSIKSVTDAKEFVPSLGSGAIPPEVLTVTQEAVILSPYSARWLAAASAAGENEDVVAKYASRIDGEMLRLFSADGRYDGTGEYTLSTAPSTARGRRPRAVAGDQWATVSPRGAMIDRQLSAELAKFSYLDGTPPSPVGVTAWRQPWVPLWIEWRAEVVGNENLHGWTLGDLDFERDENGAAEGRSFNFVGRNPIGRGLANALHSSIERWLEAEQARDEAGQSVLTDQQQADLVELNKFLTPLDLASASLDGLREQLLGIDFVGAITSDGDEDDTPIASRDPMPLFGGTVRLVEMRLVDAFGRILDVPLTTMRTPSALEVPGSQSAFRLRPRLQHGARWLFRFVDPGFIGDPADAPDAWVDQLRSDLAVNPVAGFLLADHIDEALEMFDVNGSALGQLSHHEITGTVRWEPAPGRPVPPGAGPHADLAASARAMGEIAAGVVRSDIRERNRVDTAGGSDDDTDESTDAEASESALSAMLRAIDSTLWSIDTYSALGSPTVAGLVGRPIAVVRANLRLDAPDDLHEVVVTAPGGEAGRREAFGRIGDLRFPVRLGDLRRNDDALLGFFVDGDYSRFHLVDKAVAGAAREGGRLRGQLGLLGEVIVPKIRPLDNEYIALDDTLHLRPGQTVRLTLLMLPGGRVHLTSGLLPKKALALQSDWISAGLPKVMPSVRVGPVLVDPEEIRLPKVNLLEDRQQFTRRTGPLTWRDDPIVAATQSALLPRMPHEVQEGWIRIMDEVDDEL